MNENPFQQPASQETEVVRRGFASKVFAGDKGLRAGWRLFLYLIAVVLLVWLSQLVLRAIFGRGGSVETPGRLIAAEFSLLVSAMLPAYLASLLEKRPWSFYGLPCPSAKDWRRFAVGLCVGFALLSFLLLMIYALHGFSMTVSLHGASLLRYAVLWGIAFLIVGIVEEFLFRGYSLYTLATGMGFWPAALVLCVVFGGLHLLNPGEDWIGGVDTALTALVFVFSLWRTGTLWFAVGMHASWDWGESFFYGVPDSGQKAVGTFLNPQFHGPKWLTGGSVGPEGSMLVFGVTALMFLVIHLLYPKREWGLTPALRTSDQDAGGEHQHSA